VLEVLGDVRLVDAIEDWCWVGLYLLKDRASRDEVELLLTTMQTDFVCYDSIVRKVG
jgi:hypothetical protein